MDGRQTGSEGEERAAAYVQGLGYKILERNKRYPFGEIDILAEDGETLVIIEVKAGKTGLFGYAIARVGTEKQRKLRQLAARLSQDAPKRQLRIDVVNVDGDEVIHIPNAVEAW